MTTYMVQPVFLITHVCYGLFKFIMNNKKYSEKEKESRFKQMVELETTKLKEMGLHKWLKKNRTSYQEVCTQFTRITNPIIPIEELLVEGVQ